MRQLAYSSMAAFLAHYRALNEAAGEHGGTRPLSADEHETLAAMRPLIEALTPEERASLVAYAAGGELNRASSEKSRRRERAETKLRGILLAQGALRG